MVTDQLLALVHGLVSALVALMPQWDYPLANIPGMSDLSGYLVLLNSYVPFAAPVSEVLKFLAVALPALLGYRAVLWIYNRIRG